jgi:hypothetical protein
LLMMQEAGWGGWRPNCQPLSDKHNSCYHVAHAGIAVMAGWGRWRQTCQPPSDDNDDSTHPAVLALQSCLAAANLHALNDGPGALAEMRLVVPCLIMSPYNYGCCWCGCCAGVVSPDAGSVVF